MLYRFIFCNVHCFKCIRLTVTYLKMFKLLILLTIIFVVDSQDKLLGCYNGVAQLKKVSFENYLPKKDCINECNRKYYRYAFIKDHPSGCSCGNYLAEQVANVTCDVCTICGNLSDVQDVFFTGNLVPGPPRNVYISNITENSLRISWQEPESFVEISQYRIKANILNTYTNFSRNSIEWMYSNDTCQTEIITLLPATKYNITLSTKSPDGDGAMVYRIIETKFADPDSAPEQPKIINTAGKTITVKLTPTPNSNGPVSAYRIIVINNDENQGFDKDTLTNYSEAHKHGQAQYIAAEIDPRDIEKEFVVGDGKTYGNYFNAPLNPDFNYNIILAVVSRFNGSEKVRYSDPNVTSKRILFPFSDEQSSGDPPAVIIGLSVAIGLLTFMLIAGIIGFIILKSRVVSRRQRLSDNQELTLQGPMIEVENNGYIHEDDIAPVNHYRILKQKVKIIPSSQLKIEPTNLLGVGKFGRVNSGKLHENDTFIPVAVYSIQDKKLSQEAKKSMLQDLDVLIKVGRHENLIGLIGTSENAQMINVVLELVSMNLKDLLLSSRDSLPGKFSSMSESQALNIARQVCQGMEHLETCKILHRQLCARSVIISNGVPKITSYGIAQYFSHNKIPDYTRWTALEVFKNQPHNPKSDVWSYACLVWEICTLGGTPYGNVPDNNEIPDKITKGVRLHQIRCMSDEFYQLLLDCWQQNCDERPRFSDLHESLSNFEDNTLIPPLSFNLYSNFQYEQFYPDMELAVRPVF